MEGSNCVMANRGKNRNISTIWAVGINLIVFVVLWYAFGTIPMPAQDGPDPVEVAETGDTGPGETFGQYTHLIGDGPDETSTASVETSVADTESYTIPPEQPVSVSSGDVEPLAENPPEEHEPAGVWIDEFYLDRGPALSFSPRLTPEGTFREHPYNPDRYKAPTYEDQVNQYPPEEINWPVMTPARFSKLDLPEELRDFNLILTVRIHLDARGNLLNDPVIVQESGHPLVDQITIDKIKNEASFTNASLIDTGEPISLEFHLTVFWEFPISD